MTNDKYVLENWPNDVPRDCTNLINQLDCLTRGDENYCLSCKTFDKLASEA